MRRFSCTLVLALSLTAQAEIKPHPIFADQMVLQRDQPLVFWGRAEPGEEVKVSVTVTFAERAEAIINFKQTEADASGSWRVELPALPAATQCTVTFSGKNNITLKNVLVGDVWLCSGQSNMEWKLSQLTRDDVGKKTAAEAVHTNLRFLTIPNRPHAQPQATFEVTDREGRWRECTPETALDFSAVAYYFARELLKVHPDVPIGLIAADWGGTPCEAWISAAGFQSEPTLKHFLDAITHLDEAKAMAAYEAALAKHREAAEKAKSEGKPAPRAPLKPVNGGVTQYFPSALYNGMIAPLIPFSIRGVIWYQGESNSARAQEYRTLFPAMIADWRKQWGSDFPFLAVQLAPFRADGSDQVSYAELRDAQFHATRVLPKVGLAVITDAGEENDIHPQRKEPAGVRLALAARAIAYGEDVLYSGPVFKAMTIEGNQAVLRFEHVGGGLVCRGETLNGFTMCGEDRVFHPARAVIDGDTVVVTCDAVPKPVAVRFGWANFPKPELNFYNQAGLPAVPFRTDDFPLTTR